MNKIGFNFLLFIIIYVYYILIDGAMIFLYTGKAFGSMIKNIQKGEPMKTRMIPGIICFLYSHLDTPILFYLKSAMKRLS